MSDAKSSWSRDDLNSMRGALATWYRAHHRPLPWRTRPSLYRTVVSEFMCQQTQIDTVLPYFDRWMRQFPDFAALAAAPEAAVLKAWEGLGYYARARNLHRLAAILAGPAETPSTPEGWRALPGIGPYTAAAITSIAFAHRVAVVDGNVIRVIARLCALDESFNGNQAASKRVQPFADALLDPAHPGDHNQAMMELGATHCLKHRPACLLCPLRPHCAGYRTGLAEQLPRIARRATEKVTVARVWIEKDGQLLLQTGAPGARRLAQLAELPRADGLVELNGATPWVVRQRGISHQRITEPIYRLTCDAALERSLAGRDDLHWHDLRALSAVTLSGPHRRWIEELAQT